ncbi:MAG TPA: hypothetical protein VL688_05365 [Verrucomicrobiae bacterium]|jgi:putative exosortase-associated protein (TIGR04073 family)|nr:hypothetical protein [Verrucomicrobiae bacterium]
MIRRKVQALSLILFLTFIPVALADGTVGDYFYLMGHQLVRGVVNVVTSPADIPCTAIAESKQGGSAFTGTGKGFVFMLRRILVGVTELGTFILPRDRTIPPVCQTSAPPSVNA